MAAQERMPHVTPVRRRPARHRRNDGALADGIPGYRRFMPALMPSRTESAVYFDQVVRTAEAEQVIAELRSADPTLHPTFFHVVLWALARTLARHPGLNRFVAGGRLYQRDGIWISYTAKTQLDETGVLVEVKRRFEPSQPFLSLVSEVKLATAAKRAGSADLADKELELFLHLPPALRRGVVRIAAGANALNLLPRSFVADDPFFASAFVTNLGSIGLDAAFHHLYEYGTIPIFCAVGRIKEGVVAEGGVAVVARVASIKITFDERIEDGLYAAHALDDLQQAIEHPIAAGILA